ncbi:MAG TPA: amidohydrolase family protein [Actinomycetota bacterium]|nr:amidohydrolase family protein [Actinomycetota bacterium]
MIVDVHAHVIVPEITREAGDESWRPDVRWEDGEQVVEHAGKSIRSAVHEFVRIEPMMQQALGSGVDGLVLSPWVALLPDGLVLDDSLRICRIQNAALAALAQAHPGRIRALGAVPLHHPEAAAAELQAVMAEPGLSGVEVPASIRGNYLGDDRFLPFWESAAGSGAVVFVHPTTRGFELPVFERYYLWNTVANPVETAVTGAHLVMAGVLERFPRLRIVMAHGGGALLSVRGRLRRAQGFQPQARERLQEPPDVSMRRLYFDTVTHDPGLLRSLIEWAGAGHVLLGSDRPFDMGTDHPVDEVRGLGLSPQDEADVLGGNAERLMGGFE